MYVDYDYIKRNIKGETIKGIKWSAITQFSKLAFQFIFITILARILNPNVFGLLAMATVFTNLAVMFRDIGLEAAVVQSKRLDDEILGSIFWVNIIIGFTIFLVLALLSPIIAYLYQNKDIILILAVLSIVFFISSFGYVQNALLKREIRFKLLAFTEIIPVIVSGIMAVIMALKGFGVWSLVFQTILYIFFNVLILWQISKWRPKMVFNFKKAKQMIKFGLNLTGFNIVNYFSRNCDNFLVGKYLGSVSLGAYDLAYKILLFPLNNISHVIGRVLMPVFSTIQENKSKIISGYMKSTLFIAMITFPLLVGIFVMAPLIIKAIFGMKWIRSIFLIQIFSIVGIVQSICTCNGVIYLSLGRTDLQFKVGAFFSLLTVIGFIIGLNWGLTGIALAYLIVTLLLFYPSLAIPLRLIGLNVGVLLKQFIALISISLLMGLVVFYSMVFITKLSLLNELLLLIIGITIGLLSYIIFLLIFRRKLFYDFIMIAKTMIYGR